MNITENRKLKYTCLFGGGGARGFAYGGALQAIEDLGIEISMTGGSSVGAIVASLVSVGYNSSELKDIFMKANFELFRDIRFGLGKDFSLSKGEVFTEWLRGLLRAKLWGDDSKYRNKNVTFKDIKLPLVVITTNLSNFKCQEFSQAVTPDYDVAQAVRISCSMPGLMAPMDYNGTSLVDGDLQKSMPMWKLSDTINKSADRVLELRLEGDYSGKERNVLDYLNTIYSCMMSVGTELVSNLYRKNDKYECVKINTRGTIIVDFNMSKEARKDLFALGYDEVNNYFKSFLPLKKRFLLEKYKSLFILAKDLDIYVKSSQVQKAKGKLGDLFIELADCRDNIDERIYAECLDVKNRFKESVVQGLLGDKFLNKDKLNIVLGGLTARLTVKIKELEAFVQNSK